MTEVDQIIEEIRRSRNRMSEECGHDLRRYIEYLKQFNAQYAEQVERFHQWRRSSSEVQTPRE